MIQQAWVESDDEDTKSGRVIAKPEVQAKKKVPKRANVADIMRNGDLRPLFLYARAMLGIHLLAVVPFPTNDELTKLISVFTKDYWQENPRSKGTVFSNFEVKTVS